MIQVSEEANAAVDAVKCCSDALDIQLLLQKDMSPVDPASYLPVSGRYVRHSRIPKKGVFRHLKLCQNMMKTESIRMGKKFWKWGKRHINFS